MSLAPPSRPQTMSTTQAARLTACMLLCSSMPDDAGQPWPVWVDRALAHLRFKREDVDYQWLIDHPWGFDA